MPAFTALSITSALSSRGRFPANVWSYHFRHRSDSSVKSGSSLFDACRFNEEEDKDKEAFFAIGSCMAEPLTFDGLAIVEPFSADSMEGLSHLALAPFTPADDRSTLYRSCFCRSSSSLGLIIRSVLDTASVKQDLMPGHRSAIAEPSSPHNLPILVTSAGMEPSIQQ